MQVRIDGPVLLLMGPIGLFFARFCDYLRSCGIPVTKVMFPLREFGFPASVRVPYSGSMDEWRPFLRRLLKDKGIRHIFMYGDFIIPHRIAIQEAKEIGIEAWVFELGYLRPNYVTLERERVNSRSNLNQPVEFYRSLPAVNELPDNIVLDPGLRWRKIWKSPTFIQHAFTRYPIIEGEHKLQPSPRFLWCQLRGSWRYWLYRWQEQSIKRRLLEHLSFFLTILQVSSDSQIQLGSPYRGMHDFIEDVIASFACHAHASDHLAFKHHPRDRGYNNYATLIALLAKRHGVSGRVHYFHDGPLSRYLRTCRGVITVNSTVGLQALFHAVPTKTMGSTFYNLPGLTDQKPLDDFWRDPQPSERPLFYRFYNHLVTTTQVNGNFDGDFPFRITFPIVPEARSLEPSRSDKSSLWSELPGIFVVPARILSRLGWIVVCLFLYAIQLVLLGLRRKASASHCLSYASQAALRALGIRVLVDDSHLDSDEHSPVVHIYNHENPIDVLVIQGVLRLPSITTAGLHMNRFFPWFSQSASNAGHVLMDHMNSESRASAFRLASIALKEKGEVLIAPNGSLVTPISKRVSPSALLLARRYGARIVPWIFRYYHLDHASHLHYRPLNLLISRLVSPIAVIYCKQGRSDHFDTQTTPVDRVQFEQEVQSYYRNAQQ